MKAVILHGQEDLRVEDREQPTAGPGEVLLKDGFCGICGSDLHLYYAPDSVGFDFHNPHPVTGSVWPQILGHEYSGAVVAVGEGVTDVKVGDNVAVFPLISCGECEACQAGDINLCPRLTFDGIQAPAGGMAEYKAVPAERCFVLPEGTSLEMGALVEPMAVAYRAAILARADEAKVGVVVGGGPIGVGAYFALKSFGVETVIVSEPSEKRREVLRNIGVEQLIDPTSENLPEKVREISGGRGADVVIDCAGAPVAFPGAVEALALKGRLVVAALYEKPVEFNPYTLFGDKTVTMSMAYIPSDFAGVIDGIKRGIYTEEGGWIETVPLAETEAAIKRLREGQGMKILVNTSA